MTIWMGNVAVAVDYGGEAGRPVVAADPDPRRSSNIWLAARMFIVSFQLSTM